MRIWGYLVLLTAVVAVIALLAYNGRDASNSVSLSVAGLPGYEESLEVPSSNRKLKENDYHVSTSKVNRVLDTVSITEDYPRYDPVPSSKASVGAGPIEHGTPLMPYVPGPIPPGRPKQDVTP